MSDITELEREAQRVLSSAQWSYIAAGADDGLTARRNREAWDAIFLSPHVLRDISQVSAATTILGRPTSLPIMIAPTGRHRVFDDEGEVATARGAADADAILVLSYFSTRSIADVAAAHPAGRLWIQMPFGIDPRVGDALRSDTIAHGYEAVVVTVDQPVPVYSAEIAADPLDISPDLRLENVPGRPRAVTAYNQEFAELPLARDRDADALARFIERSPLPVVVKGVLRPDDARLCSEAGAAGIIVSNHGGRTLDTAVPTALALPAVAQALGDATEIYVDGGIRRGTDVLKALALGARAVLIGRPSLVALAVGGSTGVTALLSQMSAETERALALCGLRSPAELTRDMIRMPPWEGSSH